MICGMSSHNSLVSKLEGLENEFNLDEFVVILKKMYLNPITKREYNELLEQMDEGVYNAQFSKYSFHRYFRGRLKYSSLLEEISKIKEEEEEDDFF